MSKVRFCREVVEGQVLITTVATNMVSEAARTMRDARIGAILILEDGKLVGIFTERDALFRVVAGGLDPNKTPLSEVMTRDPKSIHSDKPFANALAMMHAGRFRHVPVIEDGRPCGILSSRDAMGPELEDFMYSLIVDEETRRVLA